MKKNKKPLASYKKAVQSVLQERTTSIANAFGGVRPLAGISTNHAKGLNQGYKTPKLGRGMTGPAGVDIDMINKEEELTSRAPALLPFPLDNVFDHIVDAVSALQQVDRQMKSAIESNITLSDSKLIRLKEMEQFIFDNIEDLVKLGKNIESLNIDEI